MRVGRPPAVLLALLLLLWGAVVLGGYYAWHKPFNAQQLAAVAGALLDLLLAASIVCVAGGVGNHVLPPSLATSKELSPVVRAVLDVGLGCGLLSLTWLALGLAAFWYPPVAWLLLAAALLVLRRDCLAWLRDLSEIGDLWARSTRFERTLAASGGIVIISRLAFALAPPTDWDALMYHLQLPRAYLDAGRFLFVADNPYWGQPQLVEMLFTWAMALRGPSTATTLACLAGILVPVGVLAWVADSLPNGHDAPVTLRSGAWVGAITTLAGSTFRANLSNGSVDDFSALFGLCCAVSLATAVKAGARQWIIWAGLFASFGVGAKFTSGLAVIALAPFALAWWRQGTGRTSQLALAAAVAALAASPWLIKNAVATGNPIFPYLFETPWVDAQRAAYFAYTASASTSPLWLDLFLPLRATWLGVPGAPGFATDIGPLLLWLCLPHIWLWRQDRLARLLAASLAIGWLLMAVAGRVSPLLEQTRLYFALLPLAAAGASLGWEAFQKIETPWFRLGRVSSALLLLVAGLCAWQEVAAVVGLGVPGVIVGTTTRDQYAATALGPYFAAAQSLSAAAPNGRVLALWEPRGFYLPANAQADWWIDRWYEDRRHVGQPAAILRTWQQQGFTRLLLATGGAAFERANRRELGAADWEAFDELLAGLPAPRALAAGYDLYELTPRTDADLR